MLYKEITEREVSVASMRFKPDLFVTDAEKEASVASVRFKPDLFVTDAMFSFYLLRRHAV